MLLDDRHQNWPQNYAVSVLSLSTKNIRALFSSGEEINYIARIYHPFYAIARVKGRQSLDSTWFGLPSGVLSSKLGTFRAAAAELVEHFAGINDEQEGPHLSMIIRWIHHIALRYPPGT